jgi:DNA-directed RNA polymerase beta' subunit
MIEVHDIASIQFGIYTPEEIKKISVCKIDNSKLTGTNSVYDNRMGSNLDSNDKCVTCGLKKECWGHFGHIELAEPVLHPMYYKAITAFLKCFCKKCNRLILTKEQLDLRGLSRLKGDKRFNSIYKLDKNDLCGHCGAMQPKIVYKPKDGVISMSYKKGVNKIDVPLNVEDIRKIFNNVIDEDIKLLGLSPKNIHPRSLILSILPVIPPCSRPFIVAEGNICDDDLTYQYVEIIKINNQLIKGDLEGINEQKKSKLIQSLKFRIQTLMNNSKGKAKHPTDSRPLKCIKQRLAGKGGRIRGNLMGKRVNMSSRSVITCGADLPTEQYGIPHEVAQTHTKPVGVTSFNIDYLKQIINEGKANFLITTKQQGDETIETRLNLKYAMFKKGTDLVYGDIIVRNDPDSLEKFEPVRDEKGNVDLTNTEGALIIKVKDNNETLQYGDKIIRNGNLIEVRYPIKKEVELKLGDIVEVQLQSGDYVLINRQPTLHIGSMLAFKVVPLPGKSFRFNLATTKSFNADFDGDEQNEHAPQSYEAITELKYMPVKQRIITPQESKPIITPTQDTLIAMYLMTKDNFPLTKAQFFDLCLQGTLLHKNRSDVYDPVRLKKILEIRKKYNKGSQILNSHCLLSLLFPPDFNYEKKNNAHPTEPTVKIVQGVFLEGALDKSTIGSAHYSIIQLLNKEYGPDITINFIDNLQFIGNKVLLIRGFSVGLEDCMITSESSVLAIENTLAQCYTKAEGIEETTQNPGIKEIRITAALSQAKDIGMKIAKEAMNPKNNFLTTVISGAKGDFFNIAQLTGLLGQQNLENQRVKPIMSHNRRTLPHYPLTEELSKEREYESRGFIRHSFIRGLSPEEFFFHAMSGRESVADTALSTSKSGYIQRKIVKICEDMRVEYDRTVREPSGRIYQFSYGENDLDPIKSVRINDNQISCDIARLADRLNTCYENKLDLVYADDFEMDLEITAEVVETEERRNKKRENEKKKIIELILSKYPDTYVNENADIDELKDLLSLLDEAREEDLEINEEDNDELIESETESESDEETFFDESEDGEEPVEDNCNDFDNE